MASVTTIQRPAEITINVSDLSVAKDISRLLKRVSGITNIKVKKNKNEVPLPLHTRLTDEDVEYVIGNFCEIISK